MSNNNTYSIRVQEVKNYKPDPTVPALFSYQRNYVVMKHSKNTLKGHVFRIDKTHYRDRKGNIKEYETMDENKKKKAKRSALRRTFDELRGLIRTNFACEGEPDQYKQLFITLTYSENMTDEKRLLRDFEEFMKRLKYAFPNDYEYITVAEPQGRGAWHIHMTLKITGKGTLWIDQERLSEIWGDVNIAKECVKKQLKLKKAEVEARFAGRSVREVMKEFEKKDRVIFPKGYRPIDGHGFTTTERLRSDDVGAYYTAYFTNLIQNTTNDHQEGEDIDVTGEETLVLERGVEAWARLTGDGSKKTAINKKALIKGARLDMYPKGFRLFRCSRGVDRPIEKYDYIEALNDPNGEYDKIYENAYTIDKIHENGESAGEVENLNVISKATYRRKKEIK